MRPQTNHAKHTTRLLMACATTAFLLGYCSVQSANADSTSTANPAQPATASIAAPTTQNSSALPNNELVLNDHSTEVQAQQSATHQQSPVTVQPIFSRSSTNSFSSQTKAQPSYATQPALDPNVDMDKVNFRVSMHIPLSSTLTYDVIYIPQSSSDIYFGNDQAQPIPAPVNVGTYKVWLSQTGYNNIVAGHNFWVSTNGGKYVFYPTWDVMPNISIGPYDPLRFGHGTYTINPYDIKAIITGQQTLSGNQNSATELLDPNQYQISFAGANPDSEPFEEVSNNFHYTFQNGDLILIPTADNNSYQVGLSTNGLANIKQALTASFNHDVNNFTLDNNNITTLATAQVLNQSRTITRTIIVKYPNGQTVQHLQTATITRSFKLNDAQTGIIWSDWSTAQWPSFTAPEVKDYQPNIKVIPEQVVDQSTANQTFTISYQKIDQPQTDHQDDHDKPGHQQMTIPGTNHHPVSGLKGNYHSAAQNQTNKGQQNLPQTGNDSNWAVLSLSGATLLSLLGLTKLRKQH
ncbi:mucin-binding protein [uncultured Limosilactobacillus sp.]|uniref:mucin-binding protein n=1 Tax=uncultured Limosilactobacillus sp. TaxID=2837629 RepID=UPI0025F7234C|nr:MBG domain-containing protein [uncultured Limosilactobacillus sp.]